MAFDWGCRGPAGQAVLVYCRTVTLFPGPVAVWSECPGPTYVRLAGTPAWEGRETGFHGGCSRGTWGPAQPQVVAEYSPCTGPGSSIWWPLPLHRGHMRRRCAAANRHHTKPQQPPSSGWQSGSRTGAPCSAWHAGKKQLTHTLSPKLECELRYPERKVQGPGYHHRLQRY